MTAFLFREDSYLRATPAQVISVSAEGGIELDRSVFYATSGGQPGDTGRLQQADGSWLPVTNAIHPDGDKTRILHVSPIGELRCSPGDIVMAEIDWDRRYRLMRMHTALHLLSVVLPYPVTGGSIGEDKGRLDFDLAEAPNDISGIEAALNAMVQADHPVGLEWISEDELAAEPDLVKTLRVKPPAGQGRVRLVRIGSAANTVDLQPCGGTHVRRTGEIGPLRIGKVEKKGRENRRVTIHFA